jgi:hypothetical protein
MSFNRLVFSGLCFLAFFSLKAQTNNGGWCGYSGKSSWLVNYQAHRNSIVHSRDVDTSWLYVPTTVHIVAQDNGVGGFSTKMAIQAICGMNDFYKDAHIRFYLVPGDPFRYINNSAWFKHDWNGGSEMINDPNNRIPGRLNAYVVSDPAGNCGYSWQDAIVLGGGCSGKGNSTWAHEAGHHLSLPHPFFGWEGFTWNYNVAAPASVNGVGVEKTDGSNCHDSGDGFCDTPPDYLNFRWNCENDDKSSDVETDPDSIQFRSDASLVMGYALDQCAHRFSPEQIEAMRANLYSEHNVYEQVVPNQYDIPDQAVVTPVSPINDQVVQFNEFTVTWDALPGATMYTVEFGIYPNFVPVFYEKTIYSASTSTVSMDIAKAMPMNRIIYWRVHPFNEWDVCQPLDTFLYGTFKTQNLSATNELERVLIAELAPNPVVSGMPATLLVSSDETLEGQLTVTDMAGRKCLSQTYQVSSGDNQIEIPTYGLAAGTYVLSLQNQKGTLIKRLSVLR